VDGHEETKEIELREVSELSVPVFASVVQVQKEPE
jgi:hypothetical protein